MANFIRGSNPIWYFVNLVGVQLDDTYYISFLQNDIPYLPQPVYQDPAGLTVWENPIPFYLNGTLPDNIYFNEDLVYRLEIRQGNYLSPSQADPLIYVINNYMVGTGGGTTPTNTDILTADNQITNPQFSVVNFTIPPSGTQPVLTISTAGTYNIAPGWQLVLTGTGSVTLTQLILSGSQNFIDNPNYALQVNSSGFSSCQLIQTLNMNGAIWSLGAVGMSILANAVTNPAPVTLVYQPSTGAGTQIASGLIPITGFAPFGGFTNLNTPSPTPISSGNPSTNTDLSTVAYVQAIINLPGTGEVQISNVELVGQNDPLPSNFNTNLIPAYQQQTNEREIDHTFHYYNPQLQYKMIPSFLVGWDFPLNPAQLGTVFSAVVGANTSFYTWDQTIVFQSITSGITTSRATNGGLTLLAASTTQAAIIQYLPASEALKLLNDIISVNINASSSVSLGVTVSLYYTTTTLPSTIGSGLSIVATLDANGHPATLNGTWTEILPINGENAYTVISANKDYKFNGFWKNAAINNATYFAIVIGTASIVSTNTITFNSVGLMNGSIATRPAPQKPDQVLRECQYYYEMSYTPGVTPGTVTAIGQRTSVAPLQVGSPSDTLNTKTFSLVYNTVKNVLATPTFYSPHTGSSGNIYVVINVLGSGFIAGSTDVNINHWTATGSSIYGINMIASAAFAGIGTATSGNNDGILLYHYVMDVRLGQ